MAMDKWLLILIIVLLLSFIVALIFAKMLYTAFVIFWKWVYDRKEKRNNRALVIGDTDKKLLIRCGCLVEKNENCTLTNSVEYIPLSRGTLHVSLV